jgi:hypothetical protein
MAHKTAIPETDLHAGPRLTEIDDARSQIGVDTIPLRSLSEQRSKANCCRGEKI